MGPTETHGSPPLPIVRTWTLIIVAGVGPAHREIPCPSSSIRATRSPSQPSGATAIVVDALAELSASGPTSLRRLARQLDVPTSTLHRILTTLSLKGMVDQTVDGGYSISRGMDDLAIQNRLRDLPRLAESAMNDLHRLTGETVNLAVPRDNFMLITAVVHSQERLRMVNAVGTRDSFHGSSLGKAYLAALPQNDRILILSQLDLVPLTPKSLTTIADLLKDLERIHDRGFAVDNEETVLGVRCVGAAIVPNPNEPIACLSIAGPASRINHSVTDKFGRLVAEAAHHMAALVR
jgi:IclR family transcriptional regulator, acetate operon repressor